MPRGRLCISPPVMALVMGLPAFAPAAAEALPPELTEKVKAATVYLEVESQAGPCTGSGFLVAPGLVTTNAHVLGLSRKQPLPPKSVKVVVHSGQPGKERVLAGEPAATDVAADLAFLRIAAGAAEPPLPAPLEVAKGTQLKETAPVFILGFPFGPQLAERRGHPAVTVGGGTISSLRFNRELSLETVQVQGDLNPGNSGGPIVDSRGCVVAVSVATILGSQIGLAIPCDVLNADLAGRVLWVSWRDRKQEAHRYGFEAEATVVDPLAQVKRVVLQLWTSEPGSAGRKPPAHGAPGDGPLLEQSLEPAPQAGQWRATVKGFEAPAGKVIRARIRWSTKETGAQSTEIVESDDLGALPGLFERRVLPEEQRAPGPLAPGPAVPGPAAPGPAVQAPPAELPKPPVVVKAPGLPPLPAETVRDEAGRPYQVLKVKPEVKPLAPNLLQVATAPSGREFYSIHKELSEIKVWDPASFQELAAISVPRYPVSLWCDENSLEVACTESKVVLVIESRTRKPVQAIRWKDRPEMAPVRVHGRAPTGEWFTQWCPADKPFGQEFLLCAAEGNARVLFTCSTATYACLTADGRQALVLSDWHQERALKSQGACASANLEAVLGKEWQRKQMRNPFLTFDRRHLLLPVVRPASEDPGGREGLTLAVTRDLQRVEFQFPGYAIAEVPQDDLLIALGAARSQLGMECSYVRRSDGRILRRVGLWSAGASAGLYVPGHELLIFLTSCEQGEVKVYRVGPVAGMEEIAAASGVAAPTTAKVGEEISFKPAFSAPPGAKQITYRLQKGPHDAAVDAKTGAFTWKASRIYLGRLDVSMVAVVDGEEMPCVSWIMQVRL